MNDLVTHLRNAATDWDGLPGHDNEEIIHYITCKKAREIADHIEAQEKLICDLSDCLEDMTKHYVEVRNDLYGFEATEEIEVIAAGKLIALSKSNPNTPERNDE